MTTCARPVAMAALSTWSRIFALGSVPGTADEAHAFLQRRIGLYFATIACIGWTLYVVAAVVTLTVGDGYLAETLGGVTRLNHLAINLGSSAVYLATRRGRRSRTTLNALDGGGTLLLILSLVLMLMTSSATRYAPEFEFLVALIVVLVGRAAIVPSEPSRTFALGTISAVLFVGATLVLSSRMVRPHAPAAPLLAVVVGVWTVAMTALTTITSSEIYGLQKRIEDAVQLGQYTLQEKIGEGGMGVVYRGRHALLRRPTAIKLLLPERTGQSALARFEREVQVTAELTHPNTVAIYDYGRTPEGIFYYAMEYLDGLDLETLVEISGPQPPGRVLHVLRQAAGALAEAHAAGLIHRDVKPANVILCERGKMADFAKLVDFGLVRELDPVDPTLSSETDLMGTPLYMAPEAIKAPASVDGRGDIYALGAVAYWMLTGEAPFEGASVLQVLARALHEPPVPPSLRAPSEIPRELEDVVMACLAKDPARRPASAAALAERLDSLGGVAAWTQADARAWWQAYAPAIAARRKAGPIDARAATVQVDLGRRAAMTVAASRGGASAGAAV